MYEARQNKEAISRRIDAGGARQRVTFRDERTSFIIQKKKLSKRLFPIVQKVNIATNVNCPSWGSAPSLGSYIHGLFETLFLSAGGGAIAMAAPAVPNRTVEQINPLGGISDFAEFFPGVGMGYGELKPNTPANLANGAAHLAGLNPIIGLALPGIPLNNIDPNAPPQPVPAVGPPIYGPVPALGAPAPAPGAMPSVHFAATGVPGLYAYDAW